MVSLPEGSPLGSGKVLYMKYTHAHITAISAELDTMFLTNRLIPQKL